MNTIQFLNAVFTWLQSDPAHAMVFASAVAALTPTPTPGTVYARLYKLVDVIALNFLHAKDTGVGPSEVAQQVAAILAQQKAIQAEPATVKETQS